ncbi:MAG: hypothetical protein DI551_01410 [Micavibrio aeruginosavorus]|uniref:Uncharacterized protein n=1 Tax=Micavibrio aeruginosavorus TaxID=349221 RepID=A0A2W5Q1N6_9BACT|nr:MAG: hypothetical protein DI551_01410 [Micavibrio aeruginosavorus]
MASNNIILAVPSANSTVNYELPDSESAKLSFTPEDIDGLKLDANGGLVISFVEGGQVTLSNFQSFIDNGNTLSLADGTNVDPKLLFNALGGQNDNPFPGSDEIKIGIPADGTTREITLEPGKKYLMNFDLSETSGADVKDGKMVIGFANGGKIVIDNYETAMAAKDAPELSLASKTCVVSGDELITNIQELAKANPIDATVLTEEELAEAKRKSQIQAADMSGEDNSGVIAETKLGYNAEHTKGEGEAKAEDLNAIKTAAGNTAGDPDSVAAQLAAIETAAGGPAGISGGGYRFGSRFTPDPFTGKADIGPINPTALNYRAPILEPSVYIAPDDANPLAVGPDLKLVDETNLADGPVSISGSIDIDYGADGPGGVSSNGAFSSGGSQTNNHLTSNGSDVTVKVEGNNYVGRNEAGEVVFELVVNPKNGDYTFTQYLPLDHADKTNPDDVITLNFGVTARDGDGDSVRTTIKIGVADDGPSIQGDENTIDETDLKNGPIVIHDSLVNSFGQDGPGKIETTGAFSSSGSQLNGKLSSAGVDVVVTQNPDGSYVGKAGDVTVFTLAINAATGEYTFTQFKPLDHADANDANDIITLTFGAKITDYDGDVANAPIVINIKDDAPIFQPPEPPNPPNPPEPPEPPIPGNPTLDKGLEIVDETNLKGGPAVETGTLDANFGVDVPGTYGFQPGSFASSGSQTNGQLSHNGVPVVTTLENGVWVGKAGDKVIYTLELNPATGEYKFTLLDNLDHADKTNPDDQIQLDFGVIASDSDGDTAAGSIRIIVKDDGPVANDDFNTYDTTLGVANGNVVTGVNGGPGAADVLSTDAENTVIKVSFGDHVVDVPATGTASIEGTYGTLVIDHTGAYTYTLKPGVVPGNGGTGGSAQTTYTQADAAGTSPTVTKNGITITANNGLDLKWVDEGAGGGIGIGGGTGAGGDKIFIGETLTVTFADNPVKVDVTVADIGSNNLQTGFEYKIYVEGSDTPITGEIGIPQLTVVDGKVTFSLGSDITGGKEITKVELYTSDEGQYKASSMLIADINAYYPAEEVCIEDKFGYVLQDGDGDTDPATLTLCGMDLTDDVPQLIQPAAEIVDETNLNAGNLVETGNILVNWGADVPGTIGASGSFTSEGSKLNGALTHNGIPVVVSSTDTGYTGIANGVVIFTLTIASNGSYTFTQFDNLDHADGNNPNDEIQLNFGVIATDGDGDYATTTIVVKVLDDAPVANNDVNTYDTNSGHAEGNVITGLNGGAGAADVLSTDATNTVTKVSFGSTTVDVPANGEASIDGQFGTLHIKSDGSYTYEAFTTGGGATSVAKEFISGPALPDFDEGQPLDGVEQTSLGVAPGNLAVDAGDTISVSFLTTNGAWNNNTLGVFTIGPDGSLRAETILIPGGSQAVAGQEFSYTAEAGAVATGFFLIQDGAALNDYSSMDFSAGELNFVYDYGLSTQRDALSSDDGSHVKLVFTAADGTETVLNGNNYFTSDRGGVDNLNSDDSVRVVSGIPGDDNTTLRIGFEDMPGLGDKDFNDMIFDVKIKDYDCGCNNGQKDVFTYVLTDADGDSDPATLTLNGKDLIDSNPIFATPANEIVDETNLKDGALVETGKVGVDFGADGPGTVTGNGSFSSSGSQTNGVLSSNGVAIQVTQSGNMYFGKANGVTVFTLTVKDDGSYTYKQYENLDHADKNNPDDEINLNFGLTATDCDGDTTQTTLTVVVRDDAPIAKNDTASLDESGTVHGNVTDNDLPGQDNPATVTKVEVNGKSEWVPSNGSNLVITGTYGTLTINKDGVYTYVAKPNADGVDKFTYTLTDRDGDNANATLEITVNDTDTTPCIIKPADEIVDETNLKNGTINEGGKVEANFYDDGPGKFSANGSFTSGGSKLNGALTHNGVPVLVGISDDKTTYTGTANGVVIFTLTIAADGNYSFKLYDNLDHADGNNPDDIITLNFGVDATDADGDYASATITVQVKDDAPVANDDHNDFDFDAGQATGNVVTGLNGGAGAADVLSQDDANKVSKISFGSTTVNVPSNGADAVINGTYGKLTIHADGSYKYVLFDGVSAGTGGAGGSSTAMFTQADTTGTASSITKNGITIYSTNGADLTWVDEGDGDGVGIAGKGSDKIFDPSEVMGIKFADNASTVTIGIADVGSNNLTTGFEYRVYVDGVSTPISGEVGFKNLQIVNGHTTFTIDSSITGGKEITKVEIYSTNAGKYGESSLVLDSVTATYPAEQICIKDDFTYTLKDNDGDTDTAILSLTSCGEVKATPITVSIVADDACVKEDSHVGVPVHAAIVNGTGNETMTITLTGVPSGWTVSSPNWTNVNGVYTLVLAKGIQDYQGSVDFKPPANSDVDLNGLVFKVSVYDPDTNATTVAADNANIVVDAVVEPFSFKITATDNPQAPEGGKIFVATYENRVYNSKLNITDLTHTDTDGSESLKSIKFTLQDGMDNTTYISVKNDNGTFTKIGTQGSTGADTTYTIDLSGMTYEQALNYITTKLYLTNTGHSMLSGNYNLGVTIESYEKNLSGVEKDYSDNLTSYTVCLPIYFCISPLVIDMNHNGVELLSQENGVLFDINSDGSKDQTGWVGKDDALLVLDKNHDGIINDRSELFGNNDDYTHGFANLSSFDSNKDGVIDAKDDIFKDLKVWQDANSDGISQAEEMKSLSDVGIKSIGLQAQEVSYDIAGNPITHQSSVTFEDGSKSDIVDAWFAYKDGANAGVDKGLTLVGTDGSDVMVGGGGHDLYGGAGADTFLFQTINEGVDNLKDFNATEGDKIDLSGVLSHFDPVTDAINDFVFATDAGDGKTVLSVNENGTGAEGAHAFAVIDSGNVNVTDLFNNGNLIA